MTSVHLKTHSTGASNHDCGCGCGGNAARCCRIECLVRPNFYCGQLLTDADLSAVVKWTRDRFALSRYRDGWGVVCGLEVTCSEPEGAGGCGCHASSSAKVWINTGYAVDCCGNDLVVCEPIAVDLGSMCRPEDDPCGDPCFPTVVTDPRATDAAGDMIRGGLSIPRSEQIVVDLYLRYGEQPANGQRPIFRGNCADQQACEPSRMHERPVPVLVRCSDETASDFDPERERFEAKLKDGLRKAILRIRDLLSDSNPDTTLRKLANYRIYGVCFIADALRALSTKNQPMDDAFRAQIGAWLMIDWVQHAMICECATCQTDQGVPIARLWLWRKGGRTECCRPLIVSSVTPHRRDLRPDCRPIPLFKRDLSAFYGSDARIAKAAMLREGVEARMVAADEKGGTPIEKLLAAEPLLSLDPADRTVTMRTVHDVLGVSRVVFFEHGSVRPTSDLGALPTPTHATPTSPPGAVP